MTLSFRRRIYAASALLISLQVAGTVLGFASWGEVRDASAAEEGIAAQREALSRLGAGTRDLYVHQAHTLIERGPGHLDHLSEVQGRVGSDLSALAALDVGADEVEAIRGAVADANVWFAAEVVPRANAGTIDQADAVRLHTEAERLAMRVQTRIDALAGSLDGAQRAERATINGATRRAWVAVAALTAGGILLGMLVAGRLATSIIDPVRGLAAAAAAFGAGATAPKVPEGDDELGELGRLFNRMVTQVRAAERRQLEAERLVALGQMSGAVAHELISPLAVILADPAMRAPEVAASRAEAEHARRVVQGLLGFARPGEEPPETVDLGLAASASASRLIPLADLRDVDIVVDAAPGVVTVASPAAVRQVFDNLIRNAVEASPPGASVRVSVRPGPLVEVRDRGEGIPPAVRARLYEPFVTGRVDGTGLGLAVCQRIARAHGGDLRHQDGDDGGTTAVWMVEGAAMEGRP